MDRKSKRSREQQLKQWAIAQLSSDPAFSCTEIVLETVSDDASFRRYFRYHGTNKSFIFVDAPPDKEDSKPFVEVARDMAAAGINVPIVYGVDLQLGFMMLSDLGDDLYFDHREAVDRDNLYHQALTTLAKIQPVVAKVPDYDESLLRTELALFPDWFLEKQLGLVLTTEIQAQLARVFQITIDNAMAQPSVFVHRDYHSRNLMVSPDGAPGVIDFQDAVYGPVTYDLVSLLRDCYVQLDRDQITAYVDEFRNVLIANGRADIPEQALFRRWFDLMGLQRHLKCAGIFSRLHLRDGKAGYLGDIPLVIHYMVEVCTEYRELNDFADWLSTTVVPLLPTKLVARTK